MIPFSYFEEITCRQLEGPCIPHHTNQVKKMSGTKQLDDDGVCTMHIPALLGIFFTGGGNGSLEGEWWPASKELSEGVAIKVSSV